MEFIKKNGIIIVIVFVFCMICKPVLCFIILGGLILYLAIYSLTFLNYIKKKGIESVGEILSYESDDDGHKTPIIEFETLEGKVIKQKPFFYASSDLSIFRSYKNNINKKITILYSENNPEKFVLKNEETFSTGVIVLMIFIGLIFISIGVSSLFGFIKINL